MARKTKEEIMVVVNQLKDLVITGEILKYTEKDLQTKLGFTRKTLRKHLDGIKASVGHRSIEVITLKLINILDEIMQDFETFWRIAKKEGNEKKVVFYSEKIIMAIEKFTNFLERFGIKPIPDTNVKVESTSVNINIEAKAKELLGEVIENGE